MGGRAARFPLLTLTPRQLDVLRLVATGGSRTSIALDLGIGRPTVRQHLTDIYRRLGAVCAANAVAIADDTLPGWRPTIRATGPDSGSFASHTRRQSQPGPVATPSEGSE